MIRPNSLKLEVTPQSNNSRASERPVPPKQQGFLIKECEFNPEFFEQIECLSKNDGHTTHYRVFGLVCFSETDFELASILVQPFFASSISFPLNSGKMSHFDFLSFRCAVEMVLYPKAELTTVFLVLRIKSTSDQDSQRLMRLLILSCEQVILISDVKDFYEISWDALSKTIKSTCKIIGRVDQEKTIKIVCHSIKDDEEMLLVRASINMHVCSINQITKYENILDHAMSVEFQGVLGGPEEMESWIKGIQSKMSNEEAGQGEKKEPVAIFLSMLDSIWRSVRRDFMSFTLCYKRNAIINCYLEDAKTASLETICNEVKETLQKIAQKEINDLSPFSFRVMTQVEAQFKALTDGLKSTLEFRQKFLETQKAAKKVLLEVFERQNKMILKSVYKVFPETLNSLPPEDRNINVVNTYKEKALSQIQIKLHKSRMPYVGFSPEGARYDGQLRIEQTAYNFLQGEKNAKIKEISSDLIEAIIKRFRENLRNFSLCIWADVKQELSKNVGSLLSIKMQSFSAFYGMDQMQLENLGKSTEKSITEQLCIQTKGEIQLFSKKTKQALMEKCHQICEEKYQKHKEDSLIRREWLVEGVTGFCDKTFREVLEFVEELDFDKRETEDIKDLFSLESAREISRVCEEMREALKKDIIAVKGRLSRDYEGKLKTRNHVAIGLFFFFVTILSLIMYLAHAGFIHESFKYVIFLVLVLVYFKGVFVENIERFLQSNL